MRFYPKVFPQRTLKTVNEFVPSHESHQVKRMQEHISLPPERLMLILNEIKPLLRELRLKLFVWKTRSSEWFDFFSSPFSFSLGNCSLMQEERKFTHGRAVIR